MWIDGTIYKGQYKEGKKNGFGIHIWPDESLYEGHFINNMFHGYGNYKWKDLREVELKKYFNSIKENGFKIKCTAMVHSLGRMEENIVGR